MQRKAILPSGRDRNEGSALYASKKKILCGLFLYDSVDYWIYLLFSNSLNQIDFSSFSSISMGNGGFDLSWVGLENYRTTFLEDPDNFRMVISSIGNVIVTVIVVVVFSLFLGIILNQNFIGRSVARVVFALPIIIASGVIIVLLKENVLQQNLGNVESVTTIFQSNGVLDFLKVAGISEQIVSFFEGLVNNIFDMVWRSGMQIILFLSALQSIPASSYEAAKIEGATAWESFWFVTFPMISPFLLVNTIYTIIDTFTDSTNAVMQRIFKLVSGIEYEKATAFSMVYFILIMLVVGLAYLIMNRRIRYTD